ncbi:putative RNA methyltransferase [Gordonia hirsuta DSM 44140 = NBRC 16056]|uniref:Putative RNA methyltransferase n=1 Tax=Gordonia hirsuta DSM 44140 = NBRC 16056 TaxID=1121927 RepID=L7L7J8_9ACTN|nr:RNA methyltransferase [Gordonia hirsuta]GAC55978.1 putative RNA methyltransferase [Gordonia hirsuta DSM 44140 = NBRC 16056]
MDVLTERSSRVVSLAKLHRAAVRRSEQRFLAEGANAVDAALTTGRAVRLLVREDDVERFADLVSRAQAAGLEVHLLNGRAADKLSETTTAPGVFAEATLLTRSLDDVELAGPGFTVVAVEPREPGNAGTLIRCADALGAKAAVMLGDSVDPHNGKCVRASAGSVFHIPIAVERDVDAGLARLREAGLLTLATTMDGEVPLPEAGSLLSRPHAWLFGNEAHGLPAEVITGADHRVSIPIAGRAESLNLAAASAICLYASAAAASR